ncbi:hypothetical protein BYT27DRAFT_7112011, partial [Phlegmacium glaucopus]
TVEPLLTHTPRWKAQVMGYDQSWCSSNDEIIFILVDFVPRTKPNMVGKPMGFAHRRVWIMGYCGPMGYGIQFPANQVGGQPELWDIRGYGF